MTDETIAINAISGTKSITKTIFLNASRETVWAFLTEKDKLAEWFHPADQDLVTGQGYALLGDDGGKLCWGEVLVMEKPSQLVQSFAIRPFSAGKMSTVTWLLEEIAGGTRLTLVHQGIEEAVADTALPIFMALDAGWDEHFGKLRAIWKLQGPCDE